MIQDFFEIHRRWINYLRNKYREKNDLEDNLLIDYLETMC